MVGSLHPTPVATLPFLSPHSAVVAFCEGILKYGTAWEALREELEAQKITMTLDEVRERMRTVLSLTDVTRFPIPKNPDAVIFVAATVSIQFQQFVLFWRHIAAPESNILNDLYRMMDTYRSTLCWSFKRRGLVQK